MSFYITLDEGQPNFVASNTGWSELGAWIDALDADTYPDLVHFREHSWTEPASQLREELTRALKEHAPADEDTRRVAQGVLELLEGETDAVVGAGQGVVSGESTASPGQSPSAGINETAAE